MRVQLLYRPDMLMERIGAEIQRRRRLRQLRGTCAQSLSEGYVDSLELLQLAKRLGIRHVMDIGANVGTWTLLCKAVLPDARVDAFEPLPQLWEGFRCTTAGLSDVHLHGVALGRENTQAELHVTDMIDASSLLELGDQSRLEFGLSETAQTTVTVRALDDVCAEAGLPQPDLLKLDIQGYEVEAIRGAAGCCQAAKAVISEVSFYEYYRGQALFHDVVAALAVHDLLPAALGRQTPVGQPVGQADVLFVRRSLITQLHEHPLQTSPN